MEELKLFPDDVQEGAEVLFFNLGEQESIAAYGLLQQLREKGIAAEIYHEPVKMDKQFKYAEKKKIRYVVIIGSNELSQGTATIKNLESGKQETVSREGFTGFFH